MNIFEGKMGRIKDCHLAFLSSKPQIFAENSLRIESVPHAQSNNVAFLNH